MFTQPGRPIVLNLWYDELQESQGVVSYEGDARRGAQVFAQHGAKAVWIRRAERVDAAVRLAAAERLPIRVVICDGVRRARDEFGGRASKVRTRRLDPAPWAVVQYEQDTGRFKLVRGEVPPRTVDQFIVDAAADTPTEKHPISGEAYVRSPLVRQQALARAGGKCEWCGQAGFVMDDGSIFLETHHVIPLSQEGPDVLGNVAVLCPNHHREAHYGANRTAIFEGLRKRLAAP